MQPNSRSTMRAACMHAGHVAAGRPPLNVCMQRACVCCRCAWGGAPDRSELVFPTTCRDPGLRSHAYAPTTGVGAGVAGRCCVVRACGNASKVPAQPRGQAGVENNPPPACCNIQGARPGDSKLHSCFRALPWESLWRSSQTGPAIYSELVGDTSSG